MCIFKISEGGALQAYRVICGGSIEKRNKYQGLEGRKSKIGIKVGGQIK